MKKAIIYFLGFILICFILPALLTKKLDKDTLAETVKNVDSTDSTQNAQETNMQENAQENTYNYNKYGTVKLLHSKTGEVEEVAIDDYLCNVVSAEMPATYEVEALKAQAVVARTYTIYKINNKKHDNADICDDSSCCQAWISKEDRLAKWEESSRESNWKRIESAVNETKGKIVTYNNQPINAFFHSNSGGKTEVPVNVWGGSGYPYLQVVETAGEDEYSQYSSEVTLTKEELINKLKEKYSDIEIDFDDSESIKILEYTDSQRVKTIKFGNHELSGVEARTILGLKSTNFEIIKENEKIKFTVKGYGHGVGMSQTGADTMAKQGSNYSDIIHHFYTDVEIKDINSL